MILYRFAANGDSRDIYRTRHYVTYLFFAASVFVFFLIGKKIFNNWKLGLLASLFLIISPRIFAHSFYNPKDIPFLSAYIIAIYTMLLFLEKNNIASAILHGLATGILCSIRIPGNIIIVITFIFWGFRLIVNKSDLKNWLKSASIFVLFLITALTVLVHSFPLLYTNPIHNYLTAFNIMKQYPWIGYNLYLGKDVRNQIPWHFTIVWYSLSFPLFYVLLFAIGSFFLLLRTIKNNLIEAIKTYRDIYLAAACGILPILAVVIFKSVLYGDSRQMYFCIPPLLLISVYGYSEIIKYIRLKYIYRLILAGMIICAGLAYPVYFIIRYHPYQYTYFNILAGLNGSDIRNYFMIDGWRLSNKQALEYILDSDPGNNIKVTQLYNNEYSGGGIATSKLILSESQRKRLTINHESPDYIIYKYSLTNKIVIPGKPVYSSKVGDFEYSTVYKSGPNN
jgi:hypothetical protein